MIAARGFSAEEAALVVLSFLFVGEVVSSVPSSFRSAWPTVGIVKCDFFRVVMDFFNHLAS